MFYVLNIFDLNIRQTLKMFNAQRVEPKKAESAIELRAINKIKYKTFKRKTFLRINSFLTKHVK